MISPRTYTGGLTCEVQNLNDGQLSHLTRTIPKIILNISSRNLNDIIVHHTYMGGLWLPKLWYVSEFDYQVILTTIVSSLDSTSHVHGRINTPYVLTSGHLIHFTSHVHGRIILFKPTPRFMFPNLTSHAHGKINLVHTALYTMQNLLTSHAHGKIMVS